MCTHLHKRGSVYWFRRAVPAEFRSIIGRREWTSSLGTKDRAEAKRLIPAHTQKTDAELEAAQRRAAESSAGNWPTERSLAAAAVAEADDTRREARREKLAPLIEYLEAALKGSTQDMPPHLRAFKYLRDDLLHDRDTARQHLAAFRAELAEARGGSSVTSPAPAPVSAHSGRPAALSAVPMMATFDDYAKAQGMTPGVAKDWRAMVGKFVEFLGHDDAQRAQPADVLKWRDKLASEPSRSGKLRDPATVKNHLTALRSMMQWARQEQRLTHNPVEGIVVRTPRKPKLREREFTPSEARRILTASLAPAPVALSEGYRLARRWIPWLCAYTGARVNELSQLRGGDVTQIDGIWTIRITPEAGRVKNNEARIVPLHPHLIEQGFPAVAKARGAGPIFYDASRQRVPGESNRQFKKVGERLAAWVRNEVGITDTELHPNHAWRHMFKTRTRQAQIHERIADAIQGHAPRSVGQSYGSVPLETMADAVAAMPRFEVEGVA